MIQKLLRQYGEHGNDYSPVEMGDKINELIDTQEGTNKISTQILKTLEQLKLIQIVKPEEKKENEKLILENTETRTDGYPARCPSSGDKVYFIKGLKKSWIKNLETLQKMGYDLHKVINITNEEMDEFETIEPTDLKVYETEEVQEPKDNADTYNLK